MPPRSHFSPVFGLAVALTVSLAPSLHAAKPTPAPVAQATGPTAAQLQRAEKTALSLQLTDPAKTTRVRDIIARQAYDLGLIQGVRDEAIRSAKAKALPKPELEAAIAAAHRTAEAAQQKLHSEFLARLAAELTPAQVEAVKNGMTFGKGPLMFRLYQEMLPNLTAEQKAQILAWLDEAREKAMDAGTAEEKHAWFGKYKGRINNYLSKAGYDMKAAEKNLATQR